MSRNEAVPLLIGEVCLDVTLATSSTSIKVRLGGVVHAARGMWAAGRAYAVACYCPAYLAEQTAHYLREHGCEEFVLLGEIVGAPNVILIGDAKEVGHQGYEDLLRDHRSVTSANKSSPIGKFREVVVFPGSFDLLEVLAQLSRESRVTIDIAYDLRSIGPLKQFSTALHALVISTSSALFSELAQHDLQPLIDQAREAGAKFLLLKENRGGSQLFDLVNGTRESIPAVLNKTVNSVGVGDTFTAIFGTTVSASEGAWRGMQVATQYASTTFPDDLLRDVQREFKLSLETVRALGGVTLPWHERASIQIYLAAPDFSYVHKPEVDAAVAALQYHNFDVKRPILENGEARRDETTGNLRAYYDKDIQLLRACAAVFAVPLERDAGTLVEIGMALEIGKPVITYDPRSENQNTMVLAGSALCSSDLDECLNALFIELSRKRNA